MRHDATSIVDDRGADAAWDLVVACAAAAERLEAATDTLAFALANDGTLAPRSAAESDVVVTWLPGLGWQSRLASADLRAPILDLYLPICSATRGRPITVGHLGQSLDGFIATLSGDSQFVTGQENILHLHRMRALCDAIVVGAGTVAADNPQLTTRRVAGRSPIRVVLDPTRRLGDHYRVFNDDAVETLYVCGRSLVRPGEQQFGGAIVVGADETPDGVDVTAVVKQLHERGCHRLFVEGGGVTVSLFLAANLLDRLQVAVAPLIIGEGRPAIRLAARTALSDCVRPQHRVFRMGGDIFFDCDLTRAGDDAPERDGGASPSIARII
jgi:diaminohydroxyphosphoribosylaminopyrimidine deaminase / 5-amino-6-(5-phosphoribosylamino)uracil reductase